MWDTHMHAEIMKYRTYFGKIDIFWYLRQKRI